MVAAFVSFPEFVKTNFPTPRREGPTCDPLPLNLLALLFQGDHLQAVVVVQRHLRGRQNEVTRNA
jgi:hypothetical protein